MEQHNNYQPRPEQAQDTSAYYQQPSQPNTLPSDINQRINDVFGKALAAAIMSEFPIASIIAIFFGNNALKDVVCLTDIYRSMGIRIPGKLIAARILGIVGKISGIVCTCLYGGLALIYAFEFFLIFSLGMLGSF